MSVSDLQELALVTMVIARAGVGYDIVMQDSAYLNPVCLVRIQTAMRGLLTTYWSTANWKTITGRLVEVCGQGVSVVCGQGVSVVCG